LGVAALDMKVRLLLMAGGFTAMAVRRNSWVGLKEQATAVG